MNDQRSLDEQLKTLMDLARLNGLYDAEDWVKGRMGSAVFPEHPPRPKKKSVYLVHRDNKKVGGAQEWVVVPESPTEFDLCAFKTKKEAEQFCGKNRYKITGSTCNAFYCFRHGICND